MVDGGQGDVGLEVGQVARGELIHVALHAQGVVVGIEALGELGEASHLGSGEILIVEAEVAVEGIAQGGIAVVATAAEEVLQGAAHFAGLQADGLGGRHAIDVEAHGLRTADEGDVVPLAYTHGVLGRDAQLAAVVGLGDGEARVLGREEEVAFGRGAGKAPDEVAVGRKVGVLGQIDVQGDGIAAVEGGDDVAEVFAEVEIAAVGAEAEHMAAVGIGAESCSLAEGGGVGAGGVGERREVEVDQRRDALGSAAECSRQDTDEEKEFLHITKRDGFFDVDGNKKMGDKE